MRSQGLDQRLVHFWRAGDDVRTKPILVAAERTDPTAGLPDHQRAGGRVPGLESHFPEAVDAAAGNISQIQCRGTRPANPGGHLRQHAEHGEVVVGVVIVFAVRKSGGQQCALQAALLADTDAMVLQVRALAARGGEHFLAHRIVDDADLEFAALLYRDRYREHREAVQEVGGAVERIDDPDGIVVAAAAAFLGQDRVLGIVLVNNVDDVALSGAVDFADVVVATLGGDLQALQPYQAADDHLAGAARGAHGDIEQWVHGGQSRRIND